MTDNDRWGLLLVDKPISITSHTLVNRIRRQLGIKRVGHAGTLDPMASGLMLVGIGKATRLLEYLVGCDKTYMATVRLGVRTETLDREGEVVEERDASSVTRAMVEGVLEGFRGLITQVPPRHSAIKVGGVPLHRRTRRGEDVEPPPREVTIHRLELTAFDPPQFELEVDCTSGTYIRSLANDIGEALGTGATLWGLKRSVCGRFSLEDAATLGELEELGEEGWGKLLRPQVMVEGLPKRELTPEEVATISNGGRISGRRGGEDNMVEEGETVLIGPDGELVALAVVDGDQLKPRKVFV